jgi:hypothetical protein
MLLLTWCALTALAGCGQRSLLVTDRHPYWIGYSDSRIDDPRGQFYNGRTKRAIAAPIEGRAQLHAHWGPMMP